MATKNWPDGTPGMPADIPTGGTGATKDGRALRHAGGLEPPAQNFGWLDGVKGVVGGPNRAANAEVNIGPSGPLWRKPAGKFTTGDQRNRKPRR